MLNLFRKENPTDRRRYGPLHRWTDRKFKELCRREVANRRPVRD